MPSPIKENCCEVFKMSEQYTIEYIDGQITYWQALKRELLQQREQRIQQGSLFIKCKDCQLAFEFTKEDRQFYDQKGWDRPIRCKTCRKKHRLNREKYDGLYETMNNSDKMICKIKPRSNATKNFNGFRI
jgi:hypothetical protein